MDAGGFQKPVLPWMLPQQINIVRNSHEDDADLRDDIETIPSSEVDNEKTVFSYIFNSLLIPPFMHTPLHRW